MQKQPCFVILSPGFPANEQETTVLPFLQSFVLSFKKLYPATKLIIIAFQYPYKKNKFQWNGIEIHALAGNNRSNIFRILIWLKALTLLFRLKKYYSIKGMLSLWLAECALVGQYAARFFSLKQFSWIMGQDAKPSNKVLKWLQLNKDTIVSMSPNLVQQLNQIFPVENISVIPSGINQDYFDAIPANEFGYDILGVGSLIELKNYQLFIEMIAVLKKSNPNIKAAIIGKGEQENELHQLIIKHQLQNNIELKGLVAHEQVVAYMKASNIFLHTSSYEGQAAVFVEALYCGMEVLCFDVGRLHSNENMYVCKDNDEMLDILQKVSSIKEQQKKSILIQSMEDTVKQIIALY